MAILQAQIPISKPNSYLPPSTILLGFAVMFSVIYPIKFQNYKPYNDVVLPFVSVLPDFQSYQLYSLNTYGLSHLLFVLTATIRSSLFLILVLSTSTVVLVTFVKYEYGYNTFLLEVLPQFPINLMSILYLAPCTCFCLMNLLGFPKPSIFLLYIYCSLFLNPPPSLSLN